MRPRDWIACIACSLLLAGLPAHGQRRVLLEAGGQGNSASGTTHTADAGTSTTDANVVTGKSSMLTQSA